MRPALVHHLSLHHGLITRRQALELGATPEEVRWLLQRRDLVSVHRGVYRHPATESSFEQRLWAAVMAAGPGTVVSHRTAVARHGAWSFVCSLVELTRRSTSLPLRDGVLVHRSRTLTEADIVVVDGLATTSRPRTLFDAAVVMTPSVVARIAHRWLAERTMTVDELMDAAERSGRHAGTSRLLRHLDVGHVRTDSIAEANLGRILARAGLPPVHHYVVRTSSGGSYELDWAYPSRRLGLELDGYGVHLRSVEAFDHDRRRRNELEIDGWQILNFTARQLRHEGAIVDQVRRALDRRDLVG